MAAPTGPGLGDNGGVTTPPHAPLFSFEDVWVGGEGLQILNGVNACVAEGGITGVSGPSGSGKSTLLRLCNRLEVPSRGTVRYRGTDLAALDPVALRREVGMVFQRPTPFPGTVLENLRAAAELSEDEAAASLRRVGLDTELLDRDALTLSGGESQRMCLARTLATGCEVLLADEITSALDPESATVLERLARELASNGTTILWVTHDLAQRDRIADRVLRVEEGRIVD
jgi:putative ABC transport system ATP-binding protein